MEGLYSYVKFNDKQILGFYGKCSVEEFHVVIL